MTEAKRAAHEDGPLRQNPGSAAHFTFPSIGHVEKDGTKYRLVPVAWNPVI